MNMDLLTADQASKILQKSLSTFYREVKQGIYPSVKHNGKMLFPKAAIDAHVRLNSPEDKLTFGHATNADIWEIVEYHRSIYGEDDMISYQRALEWRKANSDIIMSAYDSGEMFGSVTIIPIEEPVILAVARDEIRERDIPLTAIRKWTEGQPSAYIATIAIIRSDDEKRDARRAAFLIRNTIRWAISLHLQYSIKNWYSIGVTPEGQELCEVLGFQEILVLHNGERKTYRLDSLAQGSAMLKHFMRNVDKHNILPNKKASKAD